MATLLPSIPEYYARFIDSTVDLNRTPKVCCPFHEELTPSFSFSSDRGVWRCFGACKTGGDVVAMHQRHYRIRTRRDAEASLYKVMGLVAPVAVPELHQGMADDHAIQLRASIAKATLVSESPDDWDALDYIMSQYPVDVERLAAHYSCRAIAHADSINIETEEVHYDCAD